MNADRFLTRDVTRIRGEDVRTAPDRLALEEPLEIQVAWGAPESRQWKTVAITMRTPGHDEELAAGFLLGEGLLRSLGQIEAVHARGARQAQGWQNSVRVTFKPEVAVDLTRLERNFYTTSSCGVCGKTSLEALEVNFLAPLPVSGWQIDEAVVRQLPARLRESQAIFDQTGGLHAAGFFSPEGRARIVREDVGRHNAVDKVIGAQFLGARGSLADGILVVSGRASFELVQKALAAGIPMLVAVGAPSSLAVELAEKFGATLAGFTRETGFNIYTGASRIRLPEPRLAPATAGHPFLPADIPAL